MGQIIAFAKLYKEKQVPPKLKDQSIRLYSVHLG